jgi:hypothetical protein
MGRRPTARFGLFQVQAGANTWTMRRSFDAFIEYERPDGSLGFIGIEAKLTEPFSIKHYDGLRCLQTTHSQKNP